MLRRAWRALRFLLLFLLIGWATLALHYNLSRPWVGIPLAGGFAIFGGWAMWGRGRAGTRRWRGWAFAAVVAVVIIWFASIRPSNDRPWRPEVAVVPRAVFLDGGRRVRVENVRNFDYRSEDDFTPRYETREFALADVTSLDLLISYWQDGPVAHTFVSFNFGEPGMGAGAGDAAGPRRPPPLCVSIECRPEQGEGFASLASMFKQFELIYVVGEERDVIGVRAAHRAEQVFLYPLRATPHGTRELLRVYLERINGLAEEPEFYHLLKNNCALNIVRYANAAGRTGGFDPRHLLNGWSDRYLYESGWVDTSVPFAELRRRSDITKEAAAATAADVSAAAFSDRIRAATRPAQPSG